MIELEQQDSSISLQDAMTPMIDVIFVLIAFMMLMINVPLFTMDVELPKAVEKPQLAKLDKHVITIGMSITDEVWRMDEQEINSIDELKTALGHKKTELGDNLSIVIQSDKKVPMERIVSLFAALQALELNVSHLALAQ